MQKPKTPNPAEDPTWSHYLTGLLPCRKKLCEPENLLVESENLPVELETPENPQTPEPIDDPKPINLSIGKVDSPKLPVQDLYLETSLECSEDQEGAPLVSPKAESKIENFSVHNSRSKRKASYEDIFIAENAIHIGIDVGGTLIKVAMICKESYTEHMNLDREIRKDVRIGSFLMMYYTFKTTEIEDLASRFENKILPHYTKDYIWCTGGGALKWRSWFEKKFTGIKIRTEEEMASIYDGMQLTLDLKANIIYQLDKALEKKIYFDSEKFDYPLLIVNIGSGVSFISMTESSFKRIGGTPLGGSTFLGLCRKLIGIDDFETLIDMTEKGDEANVDLMFSDFSKQKLERTSLYKNRRRLDSIEKVDIQKKYENNSYPDESPREKECTDKNELGTSDNVTFVTLGVLPQLSQDGLESVKKEDIARSMLHLIAFNVTELAFLYAKLCGFDKIMFTGSFINNRIVTQRLMVRGLRYFSEQEGGQPKAAYFSEHDGFFGAIACIKRDLDDSQKMGWVDQAFRKSSKKEPEPSSE